MKSKHHKVVLITGASRGIGYTTALHLAKSGYIVCATVRDLKTSKKIIDQCDKHPNLFVYQLDLTDLDSIKRAISKIIAKHKRIDVLINNAAQLFFGPVESVSTSQFRNQYEVNVFGPIALTQLVLPLMRKQKQGHILFMGSTSGIHCAPMYAAYSSTKFALEALAYALASNLASWNICVSLLENSATKTNFSYDSLTIGDRFSKKSNPYKQYTINSLRFLRNITKKGQSPAVVAKFIQKTIESNDTKLRKPVTEYAKTILLSELKDPYGKNYLKTAQEELKWFNKKTKGQHE